ncbi:MAG: PIG-L family deacetylase [Candidatus Saccharibacteria bacterium]|nr:PIG-L family deacetylase [Candidatus Saccharibacteria bacterium]
MSDIRQRVANLGTIVGVWAHPDDESFTSAGLMSIATANEQSVACITATRGEAGVQDEIKWPADKLHAVRESEMNAAMKVIGVKHHHWLGYKDGACQDVPHHEAISKIGELLKIYQPDSIITFPPSGGTGHMDHVSVSRWALQAAEQYCPSATVYFTVDLKEQYERYFKELDEQFDIYFNLEEPNLVKAKDCDMFLQLPENIARTKCEALRVMPSQTEGMFKQVGAKRLCEALSKEGYVRADRADITWSRPRSEH